MDVNPKVIKLIVIIFVGLLVIYNIAQIINGENIIIHTIGIIVMIGIYIGYNKFSQNKDNDKF